MGYPMTWKRVVGRNGLADGDYNELPTSHRHHAVLPKYVPGGQPVKTAGEEFGLFLTALSGDLRRLERDTVDENATARYIARRTDINVDLVAAVLKEFMNW